MQRFMLNLRQLNKADSTETNSDVLHFSRFSVDFRVPPDLLDHGPSGRPHEDDPGLHDAPDEGWPRAGDSLQSAGPATGPPGAHADDGDGVSLDTLATFPGQSGTRWDADERESLQSARPGAGSSGTRDDKVIDAPTIDLTVEARLSLCSYRCSPRLRTIFVDAGEQS